MSERNIQNAIRLHKSNNNCRLFNNDNGFAELKDGRKIHYGLVKSSPDLIGWRTIKITPGMTGKEVAIFVGAEVKMPHKYATPEQQRFLDLLTSMGAIAGVVRSENDIDILFDNWLEAIQS